MKQHSSLRRSNCWFRRMISLFSKYYMNTNRELGYKRVPQHVLPSPSWQVIHLLIESKDMREEKQRGGVEGGCFNSLSSSGVMPDYVDDASWRVERLVKGESYTRVWGVDGHRSSWVLLSSVLFHLKTVGFQFCGWGRHNRRPTAHDATADRLPL